MVEKKNESEYNRIVVVCPEITTEDKDDGFWQSNEIHGSMECV